MNALNWVGVGDGNGHTLVTQAIPAPRSSPFDHLFQPPPLVVAAYVPPPPGPPPLDTSNLPDPMVLAKLAEAAAFMSSFIEPPLPNWAPPPFLFGHS